MANKGKIRIDGKVMGKDYGKYFYSPRGNMCFIVTGKQIGRAHV